MLSNLRLVTSAGVLGRPSGLVLLVGRAIAWCVLRGRADELLALVHQGPQVVVGRHERGQVPLEADEQQQLGLKQLGPAERHGELACAKLEQRLHR